MNSAKLLLALWRCKTKDDLISVLDNVEHRLQPIDNQTNNSRSIELAISPYSAFIEAITNAHDAVIVDWKQRNNFPDTVKTVNEALTYISENSNNSLVHVYYQKKGKSTHDRIVTICDEGCGMDESEMVRGVLATGSTTKQIDPLQHGCFGHGGASLFGQSDASLIVSRTRNSQQYTYTVVYKLESDDETVPEYYVYACKSDGRLFTVSATDLEYTRPGPTYDRIATAENRIVLPENGTIRRQYQMKVDYWSSNHPSLYTALNDRMFGSPAHVRLIGEDAGASNRRRGRRYELNAVEVGGKMTKTNAEMLVKISPVPVTIFNGKDPAGQVTISAWVIDSWGDPGKPAKTPVRDMLDGNKTDAPMGIIVTLNGQLHARLRSTVIMRNAGVSTLTPLTIIEVCLDLLPRTVRKNVLSTDRTHLKEDFEKKLTEEIVKFVKAHDEFAEVCRKKELAATKLPSNDIQKLLDDIMNDPLLGLLSGIDTIGSQLKGPIPNPAPGNEDGDCKPEPQSFVPHDPPTFLNITKGTVKCNRTEWITIRTDAPDHYSSKIRLVLPKFLQVVPNAKIALRRGRITFPVVVADGTKIGTEGSVTATLALHDGNVIKAERTITVVPTVDKPEKPEPPQDIANNVTNGVQQAAFPTIEERLVNGYDDRDVYSGRFGDMDENEASFTFEIQDDGKKLVIYRNLKFEMDTKGQDIIRRDYKADADILIKDFEANMRYWRVAASSVLCRQNAFGEQQNETVVPGVLSALTRAVGANVLRRYADAQTRRLIISRSSNTDDD